jgi:hypothetical protein
MAQAMYDERGPDGKRAYTVQHIAEEFRVTRPTIYRHLELALSLRDTAAARARTARAVASSLP